MRLIDADALYETFERTPWFDNADRDIAEELLDDAPTVEAAQSQAPVERGLGGSIREAVAKMQNNGNVANQSSDKCGR